MCRSSDQSLPHRGAHRGGATVDSELGENTGDVVRGRLPADVECIGDLWVGEAVDEKMQDLRLSGGETGRTARPRRGTPCIDDDAPGKKMLDLFLDLLGNQMLPLHPDPLKRIIAERLAYALVNLLERESLWEFWNDSATRRRTEETRRPLIVTSGARKHGSGAKKERVRGPEDACRFISDVPEVRYGGVGIASLAADQREEHAAPEWNNPVISGDRALAGVHEEPNGGIVVTLPICHDSQVIVDRASLPRMVGVVVQ